jgi:phenylacetate-CoA ligase
MLINTTDRLDQVRQAREEAASFRHDAPLPDFYDQKLSEVWERARRTRAHADLGDWSRDAFALVAPTAKDDLKAAPWTFVASGLDDADKYYETTGTTGRVTPTPRCAEDVIWNTVSVAEVWRGLLSEPERVAILLPSDIVPVADLIVGVCEYLGIPHTRAYPFSTGICDWDRLVGLWESLRPTTVFLAPGVALQLTRLLKQRGQLAAMARTVRTLMLLGEVNTAPFRRRVGQWWGADAYDASYGSTETGTLAAACPADRQHLLTTANFFELAGDGGVRPIPAHGQGRLITTPLNLYARPLLRFDTGDEVALDCGCPCGSRTPTVAVVGRSTDAVRVHGVPLSVRGVEEVVYETTPATGYLVEAEPDGAYARLLLERDVEWDRGRERAVAEKLQRASSRRLGLAWDDVVFVNALPSLTKSGASQKSWKRSNLRVLDGAR